MELIGVKEAAKILMCGENSVRRWANLGIIPHYRIGKRGDRRFNKRELKQTLESWKTTPRKEPANGT